MTDNASGYAANRKKDRGAVRLVADLPEQLVNELDRWGVAAGLSSRREATETIIKKGLEAAIHES